MWYLYQQTRHENSWNKQWCQQTFHLGAHNVTPIAYSWFGCGEFPACPVHVFYAMGFLLRNFGSLLSLVALCFFTFHRAFNHAFGILLESRFEKIQPLVLWPCFKMLWRCFQDESRYFGRKHLVVFHFVSGTPDSDHPETPEKEGLVSKKTIHWMNFASCFFWHVLAVVSCSGVFLGKMKEA